MTSRYSESRFIVTSIILSLVLGFLFAGAPPAEGAQTWDGGGDGTSWNDANNWSGNTHPGHPAPRIPPISTISSLIPLTNNTTRGIT